MTAAVKASKSSYSYMLSERHHFPKTETVCYANSLVAYLLFRFGYGSFGSRSLCLWEITHLNVERYTCGEQGFRIAKKCRWMAILYGQLKVLMIK